MKTECPRCRQRMVEGFVRDQDSGSSYASKWVEGAPEKSFWTGTKTAGKKQVPVATYRCTGCGYLESYAK